MLSLTARLCVRTEPEGQALGIKQQTLLISLVRRRHVVITADDPLKVAALPVEVASLNRPAEHRPPWPGQSV